MARIDYRVCNGGQLGGKLKLPGDKSISHRAVMLGALAEGETEVSNFLDGEDCLATARAFEQMGPVIERRGTNLRIKGVGLHGLQAPRDTIDCGNSGTSMRLLSGILAAQGFDSSLTGDDSLRKRPMQRVMTPLAEMGARIESLGGDSRAPLKIHGGRKLHGIRYPLPVASAQVKSCLLLAGLYASGETEVIEAQRSRDHTERMLAAFGYPVTVTGKSAAVRGGGQLQGTRLEVPSDISSAAFFLVGAAIVPGSELLLEDVGVNPTRAGVIEILRRMGADIEEGRQRQMGGEPVAHVQVRGRGLKGIYIPEGLVPSAIDEFPALFIAAACAEGETLLTGAAELRVKESDRIQVMADGLARLGVTAQPTADGISIRGFGAKGSFDGGSIDSHGDHRIAMSFSMAALRARAPIEILDCANVNTSFPGFADLARSAGLDLNLA
ncbi:MAG: 3-phosphoshikimate 1-carboxyvinyltransferase [Nevskiales bacterium]